MKISKHDIYHGNYKLNLYKQTTMISDGNFRYFPEIVTIGTGTLM